jgi:hypothetical protein
VSEEPQDSVVIAYQDLSAEALHGVIESFVLREGTDYGEHEVPLSKKIEQVVRQLKRGEAQLIFDPNSETVDIVPTNPRDR